MDKKLKIIYWLDAQDIAGWIQEEDIEASLSKVISVGFLVKETEESVTLSQSWDVSNLYNNIITIPKCNITSIDDLYHTIF